MPGFDGTGPLGQGPFTGGGRGYWVMSLDYAKNIPYRYTVIQGYPAILYRAYAPNYMGYGIGYRYPIRRLTLSGRKFLGRGGKAGVRIAQKRF
ncbi:MAG: DUF5320 domain-containing protein [Actinobacteria bacterium]|nr:DUF5320 domain-containing protein [Actinomycetota bacterium]